MGRIIFYAHAGSGNHGCEAIVRSSTGILGNDIVLYSVRPEEDIKYGLNEILGAIEYDKSQTIKRFSLPWLTSRFQTKITGSIDTAVYYQKKPMFEAVQPGDIAVSIGGDNYCYSGTDILAAQNSVFRKMGAKTVLWGCSVEPELLKDPAVAKDLASYDLITARESISFEALKAVNPNTMLVPDPAFVLERVDLPVPEGWLEGRMIGVNASPLILQSGKNGQLVLEAYKRLIRRILDTTDCSVALIPHVVWESNDDRGPLKTLYDAFVETGRVIMLEDHNCMELKGYIARCRMFIGARTHATIAAYSTCVPTLVLGYSVKSRGIARNLFGTEENYVIPVQGLTDPNALAEGFAWLAKQEAAVRAHLCAIMSEYQQKTVLAAEYVDNL